MPDALKQPNKRRARAPKAPSATPETSVPSPPRRAERQLKFIREVGSIVLGVLIALGIGAIADTIGWRVRAASAEKSARRDLALLAGAADERAVMQPCLKRRLDQIDAILADVRRTGVLPTIGPIGGSSIRPLPHSAISVLVDSEIALHVASETRRDYVVIYSILPRIDNGLEAEQNGWATLRVLENAPGPIDGDLLANVLIAKAELNRQSRLSGLRMAQIGRTIARLGVAPDYFYMTETGQSWAQRRLIIQDGPACRPLLVDGRPYPARAPSKQTPPSRP